MISTRTRTVIEAILVVVLALLVSIAIRQALILGTGLETPLVIVKGHSMYPFFLDGDLVVIERASVANTSKGEIIVYKTFKGKLIIHRVIDKVGVGGTVELIVKGDNNPFPDIAPINDAKLLGKTVSITYRIENTTVKVVPKIPLIGKLIPMLG